MKQVWCMCVCEMPSMRVRVVQRRVAHVQSARVARVRAKRQVCVAEASSSRVDAVLPGGRHRGVVKPQPQQQQQRIVSWALAGPGTGSLQICALPPTQPAPSSAQVTQHNQHNQLNQHNQPNQHPHPHRSPSTTSTTSSTSTTSTLIRTGHPIQPAQLAQPARPAPLSAHVQAFTSALRAVWSQAGHTQCTAPDAAALPVAHCGRAA